MTHSKEETKDNLRGIARNFRLAGHYTDLAVEAPTFLIQADHHAEIACQDLKALKLEQPMAASGCEGE